MNVGSLFSGIGGLDEGLRRAGFDHAFLCESDGWRREVLAERFPGVSVYEDIRDVEAHTAGRMGAARAGLASPDRTGRLHPSPGAVGLLSGGFPCQDLSVAGRRAGLAGDRSGLFFEFARVAESLRPGWLLVENVPGLLSSQGGRDFGTVLGTLAELGYGLAWRVLDSRFFGVPQRRRRVFILGALADGDPRAAAERAGQVLAVGARCERHPATRGEAGAEPAVASLSGLGSGGPDDNDGQGGRLIANGLTARYGKGTDSDAADAMVAAPLSHGSNPNSNNNALRAGDGGSSRLNQVMVGQSVRRLTPREAERLQALPDDWTLVPDSAPDSRRYAALGDAVTASVAEWIGTRLLAHVRARDGA